MKIVHIQTSLSKSGNAAMRLHKAMLEEGIDSSMLVYQTECKEEKTYIIPKQKHYKHILNTLLFKMQRLLLTPNSYFYSNTFFLGNNISKHKLVVEADIIYLHWIMGNFLNLNNISQIAALKKNVFIYMHDMWAITGGCHHSFDCDKYQEKCENCPMHRTVALNISKKELFKKKELYNKFQNIHFISPSLWLNECAKKSTAIPSARTFCIPNIIDENIFRALNKEISREMLNIPPECKVLTFGCISGMRNKFKGGDLLLAALNKIEQQQNILILIYGSDYDEQISKSIPFNIRFLGNIESEILMSIINNASDIFISPSLAESFGLTILENLLCNTPVVAFNNTSIKEIINHKKNGYLATNKDINDLSNGINYLLSNKLLPKENSGFYLKKEIVKKHLDLIRQSASI